MRVREISAKPRVRCTGGVGDAARIQAVYEGASRGPRMQSKGLIGVSGPNADIARSQPTLVKRARHAVRNHPYATKAVETYVSNLVGNGIIAKWKNAELQRLWDIWVNQCDADGIDNFYGLQMLAARTQFESGEVLARKRLRMSGDRLAVPMQVEMLEGDHLDIGYNVPDAYRPITMSVQYSPIGDRTHYHLWRHHPDDVQPGGINVRRPVPASDVIHLFRRLRPKQSRGVPELTPILIRLYEIDEMQDKTLVRQKTAALFAWIVKKKSGAATVAENNEFDGSEFGEQVETAEGEQLTKVTPGGIHYLEEDEELQFSEPGDIGSNYAEWLKTELRAIAVGLGLTYEQLTGDLTGVNYSSIRAGLVEFRRRIEQLQLHLMIHRFCRPIAEWFADTAIMMGLVDIPGYWDEPWEHMPSWKPPRWDWVDPLKDVMGDLLEVRSGFNTRKNKNAERGLDYDEVNEQLLLEQAINLILDSNPATTTKAGQLQDYANLANAMDGD